MRVLLSTPLIRLEERPQFVRSEEMTGQAPLPVNEQISAPVVRVIDTDKDLGVMSLSDALSRAQAAGADLVLVGPKFDPPVCRIMNYAAYLRLSCG